MSLYTQKGHTMYSIIYAIFDNSKEIPIEISKMIQYEYKNNADQEFALDFFEKNNRLPDTVELYHA